MQVGASKDYGFTINLQAAVYLGHSHRDLTTTTTTTDQFLREHVTYLLITELSWQCNYLVAMASVSFGASGG